MPGRYDAAWALARPYMRARRNDVHIPLSFDYATRLADSHPEADRDVVLLAIMLHDIGWALVDQEAIFTEGFGPDMMTSAVRIAHEREGARVAGEILEQLGEPAALREEVVEIIAGHDTRPHALSRNDELVKDADKLWRYSVAGIAVGCDWFDMSPGDYADMIEPQIEGLFVAESRTIGRADMAHTRSILRTALLGS